MAGRIKELIDSLIEMRTQGESSLVAPMKIKLIMKGIDPDIYDANSPDEPAIIQKVKTIAAEMGYDLSNVPRSSTKGF